MATYTAALFSPAHPNGLRVPFDTQWQAIQCARNAVADRTATFAHAIRKDRLRRIYYVWSGDVQTVPARIVRPAT